MSTIHLMPLSRPSVLLLALVTATATAQVPDGWVVVSAYSNGNVGGLFVTSPRVQTFATQVLGVPSELTGAASGVWGANSVEIRSSDDAILCGTVATSGTPIRVFALQLAGLTVSSSQSFTVGTSGGTFGGVTATEVLPDGRVLFAAFAMQATAPLNGSPLGVLDTDTGIVTAVPTPGGPSDMHNAITTNEAGTVAYFGTWVSSAQGRIYSVPLPGGGTPTLVAMAPRGITGLDLDNDGNLVVGMNNGMPNLGWVDVGTGTFTTIPTTGVSVHINAVTVEHATGNVAAVDSDTIKMIEPSGAGSAIGLKPPATFWGILTGCDVQDSPRTYGDSTPGTNTYTWMTRPNPGGIPTLGNNAFSVTLQSSPGPAVASALFMATARSQLQLLGLNVLLDPGTIAASISIPSTTTATVSVPIPNDPTLAGLPFHMQTLHIEGTGQLASSDGLTFGPIKLF